MVNFLNKFISFFHKSPTVSYMQPKTMNVYFKNSLEPKFISININNYNYFNFNILQKKEGDDNVFCLMLNLYGVNNDILELAIFETRKEAEMALLFMQNKLFALEKKIVKLTGLILVSIILLGLLFDFSGATLRKVFMNPLNPSVQASNQAYNQYNMPPVSPIELQKLQNEIQAKVNESTTGTNTFNPGIEAQNKKTTPETIQESGNPDVNSFVNNLGK